MRPDLAVPGLRRARGRQVDVHIVGGRTCQPGGGCRRLPHSGAAADASPPSRAHRSPNCNGPADNPDPGRSHQQLAHRRHRTHEVTLAEPGARWAPFSKNGIPSSSATVRRLISHQWWLGTREPAGVGEDLSRSPLSGRVIGVGPCGGGAGGSNRAGCGASGLDFRAWLVEAEVAAWSAPSGHMLGFPLPVRLRKSRQVALTVGPRW